MFPVGVTVRFSKKPYQLLLIIVILNCKLLPEEELCEFESIRMSAKGTAYAV